MKKHNFYAGPSILSEYTIKNTAAAVENFAGMGLSLLEISHRSKEFVAVNDEARALIKELLDVPAGYEVVFMGGGASMQFCMVPYNLLNKKASYLDTGTWASNAIKEAKLFGEVDALMTLLVNTIAQETPTLMQNNVRLLTIGDIDRLPENARLKFEQCMEETAQNTGLKMVIALSYSARWEITRAMQEAVRKAIAGSLRPEDIDEEFVSSCMTTHNMPDPDLLIRTSGELRLSNFLLWQLAYSELYFTDCLWPEFTPEEFYKAIVDYQHRERRFGKTSEQIR